MNREQDEGFPLCGGLPDGRFNPYNPPRPCFLSVVDSVVGWSSQGGHSCARRDFTDRCQDFTCDITVRVGFLSRLSHAP